MDFKGIVAAILTPFDDSDRVDLEYIKDHIRFIEEGGVQGFVPSGSNGEAPSMTLDERKAVIETCAANKRSLFMIAGTGASCISETIELSKFAESVGSDAIMVVPPYYFSQAPETGIIEYYRRIFEMVSLPIFLYNIPGCSGIRITDSIVRALEHYPHLAGIKDSSGSLESTLHYIRTFPNLKVFVGEDRHALAALAAGAAGHITGMPNAFPKLTTALYRAFLAGEDAAEHQIKLTMARDIISCFPEFGVYKCVLSLRGFPLRHCRLPLLDLSDEEKPRFERMMRQAGLWDL